MGALSGLTAEVIGQQPATRIKALTMADIAGLTAAQLPGLTAPQLALFNPVQLLAFTKAQIPFLTPAAIAGLAPGQIGMLTPQQVGAFTPEQLSGLSLPQFAALNAGDILALSPSQVKALTPAQLAVLTIPQLSVLSAADIAVLSPAQVASINPASVFVLNPAQLKALSAEQRAALTPEQLAHLTPAQTKLLGGLPNPPAPAPAPPAPTPPAPTPPAPANDTPTPPPPPPPPTITVPDPAPPPAPANDTPAPPPPAPPPTITVPDPAPPAPTPPTVTVPDPAPTPPALTAPEPTPPAPTPASDTPAPTPPTAADAPHLTPSQLAAMTGAQLAALTADQINGLNAEQLGAINLDYNKMLALLQTDAGGGITAGEFSALQALAAKLNVAGGIGVSAYLEQITDNVILGDPANATWTGGMKNPTPLGNLAANSTEAQANQLIGKWFLGTDLPSNKVRIDIAPNFTVTHKASAAPLYADGISISDINQGNLGDCFFLASLAEVAARNPYAIDSMITDNGNGTYGVRFVVNGKAEFVTVDDELANGGTVFNHGADDWAGLVEKAYAQLQGGGNVTGNPSGYGNSYTNLANGGSPESALAAITGALTITDYVANGASWKSYTFDGPSLTVPNNPNASRVLSTDSDISNAELLAQLTADLAEGDYLVLSSNKNAWDANGKATLMEDHAMAIYGFDAGSGLFNVYNPWGRATSGAQPWETTFAVGLDKLLADGDIITVASASGAGAGLAGPSPSLLPPAQSPFALSPPLGLAGVA